MLCTHKTTILCQFGLFCHKLTTISPSILNHFSWELYQHTIHSSGQIEWFKNSVDDRSVQVGGKQRICTIDGYAMALTCRGGLMYLSLLGEPADQDLERYPAVHLEGPMNGPHLSWTILTHLVMGSLLGPMTLLRDMPLIPILMNLGIIPKVQFKFLASWMTLHPL